jgi:hypothetical protein
MPRGEEEPGKREAGVGELTPWGGGTGRGQECRERAGGNEDGGREQGAGERRKGKRGGSGEKGRCDGGMGRAGARGRGSPCERYA